MAPKNTKRCCYCDVIFKIGDGRSCLWEPYRISASLSPFLIDWPTVENWPRNENYWPTISKTAHRKWRSSDYKSCFVCGKCRVQISAWRPASLMESFLSPSSEISGCYLKLSHDCLLLQLFQCINHPIIRRLTLCELLKMCLILKLKPFVRLMRYLCVIVI